MKKIKERKVENLVNKIHLLLFTIFIILLLVFIILNLPKQNISYAASTGTSDIQLMARAINGEARGEPYEGQVAIRSSYSK